MSEEITEVPPEEATDKEIVEETKEPVKEAAKAPEKEVSWRDQITDEKLRTQADRYETPTAMLENINKLQGEVSQRIKVPGEGAAEEDVQKFRKAMGIPETVAEYVVPPPEGVEEWPEFDQQLISSIAEIALANNIPAKSFSDFVIGYTKIAAEAQGNLDKQAEGFRKESDDLLTKEWGSDNDANRNIVAQVRENHADDEFKALLNEARLQDGTFVGDHPAMMRFLAKFGRATQEGSLMVGASPSEVASIDDQIKQIEKENPIGSEGYMSRSVQSKLTALYDKKYGKEGVTGSPI